MPLKKKKQQKRKQVKTTHVKCEKKGNIQKQTKQNRKQTKCGYCGQIAVNNRCGGCKCVFYCDQQCQRKHWKKHKNNCAFKTNKQLIHDCAILKCNILQSRHANGLNNQSMIEQEQREFYQFIRPCSLHYAPIHTLSLLQRMERLKRIRIQKNGIHLWHFDESIELISTFNQQQNDTMKRELDEIRNDIVAQIANIYLFKPPADSYEDTYFTHIILALHYCNMALDHHHNVSIYYHKIICFLRLGLVNQARSLSSVFQSKLQSLNNANQQTNIPQNYEEILTKERRSTNAKALNLSIKQYQMALLKWSSSDISDAQMYEFLCCKQFDDAILYPVVVLAVSDLLGAERWQLVHLYRFFESVFICNYTSNIFCKTVFQLSAVLNWSPKELAQHCRYWIKHDNSLMMESEQELFNNMLGSFLQANEKAHVFLKQFVIECGAVWEWNEPSGTEAMLNRIELFSTTAFDQQRHEIWMHFHELVQKWMQSEMETTNYIPVDGRTTAYSNRQVYGVEHTNVSAERVDFIFIHALATATKEQMVLDELHKNGFNSYIDLYARHISYLHYFALNGCVKTIKFLIKYGMDVNHLIRKGEYPCNGYEEFISMAPLSALDFCVCGLGIVKGRAQDGLHIFLKANKQRKHRIENGIGILKELGAKTAKQILGKDGYTKANNDVKQAYREAEDVQELMMSGALYDDSQWHTITREDLDNDNQSIDSNLSNKSETANSV